MEMSIVAVVRVFKSNQSSEYFGAGNVSSGLAMGIGSITRKEADAWQGKLEEFSAVCDGVVASFGKKLSVGEGFVVKKSTWSDRMTRSFDKLTNNGKTYVAFFFYTYHEVANSRTV